VLIAYRDILAAGQLGPISPDQKAVLETMRQHLERLTRLAEDAAHFARVKSERMVPDFQAHDAQALLKRVVALAQAAGVNRQVSIELECDRSVGTIEADGPGLEPALSHLVTNALRFTPDGGRVYVHCTEHNASLRISISDTGVGIAPEKLSALLSGEFAVPEHGNYRSAIGLEFNAVGLG